MAANLMYAEMGLNVIGGLAGYAVSKERAKQEAIVRKYNETMQALSAAMSLNAITANEAAARENAVNARLSIQSAAMQEEADYALEAAAAGVVGNTVKIGQMQRTADAARARTSLDRQYLAERMSTAQQREQVQLQKIYGKDISPLPKANFGAAVFGMVSNAIDIWNAHNPKSRQTGSLGGN